MEWTGLDEKIDVYSFGNNIFALLTGRTVSVENRDQKKARPSIFDVVKFLRDTTEQDNMRTLMNVENEALLVAQH